MKRVDGFLLIELMIGLLILISVMFACTHFFFHVTSLYRNMYDRLQMVLYMQNSFESSWYNNKDALVSCDPSFDICKIALPFPQSGIDLPHTDIAVVYEAWQVHKKGKEDVVITLPGYIYAK